MIGLVYYSDDPDKKVFRRVYPLPGEDPATVLADPQWTTVGLLSSRPAVLVQVLETDPMALAGTIGGPLSPPTLNTLIVGSTVAFSPVFVSSAVTAVI